MFFDVCCRTKFRIEHWCYFSANELTLDTLLLYLMAHCCQEVACFFTFVLTFSFKIWCLRLYDLSIRLIACLKFCNSHNVLPVNLFTVMEKASSSNGTKKLEPDYLQYLRQSRDSWDPLVKHNEQPSSQCFMRIKRDIMNIFNDPAPGICVIPDAEDMTRIHALITGPFDTPYEGGFFYFLISCPTDYPIHPPRVRLMTTGDNSVRFNPNLYKNGKVCLSILGTWTGPAWTPAQSLASVLISIQSLMCENPYYNEPGFSVERSPGDSERYNNIIRHETLRIAVCDVLDSFQ